jgi:hypothetical protein
MTRRIAQHPAIAGAERRAEVGAGTAAGNPADDSVRALQLAPDGGIRAASQVRMGIGVVPELVAGGGDAADQLRVVRRPLTRQEERAAQAGRFQGAQDAGCRRGARAGVERERNLGAGSRAAVQLGEGCRV